MNTTATDARQKLNDMIENATDQQLIDSALMTMTAKTPEGRMISAYACEELYVRHPETHAAITEWSEDFDTDVDMIEVLIATMVL